MPINQAFLSAIKPILIGLQEKLHSEFVVFGSAPLYLLGILEFNKISDLNDLDIALKDESVIPKEAKVVYFHEDPNQKFYKIEISGVKVDIGSAWPGQEAHFDKIFENPIIVEGFKFANLYACRGWKELMVKKYNKEKDKYYLKKIREYKLKYKTSLNEVI